MKVTKSGEEHVHRVTYQIENEGKIYHFTDYLDMNGKVVDSELRDNDGNDIDDPALFEQIEQVIDEMNQ